MEDMCYEVRRAEERVNMCSDMTQGVHGMTLYCSYRNKNLASAIYLFGLGARLPGPGLKHMRQRSHHDPTGALVIPLLLRLTRWRT